MMIVCKWTAKGCSVDVDMVPHPVDPVVTTGKHGRTESPVSYVAVGQNQNRSSYMVLGLQVLTHSPHWWYNRNLRLAAVPAWWWHHTQLPALQREVLDLIARSDLHRGEIAKFVSKWGMRKNNDCHHQRWFGSCEKHFAKLATC